MNTPVPGPPATGAQELHPLLVTGDPQLREAITRRAGLAGLRVTTAGDLGWLRQRTRDDLIALIGADQLPEAVTAGFTTAARTLIVTPPSDNGSAPPPPTVAPGGRKASCPILDPEDAIRVVRRWMSPSPEPGAVVAVIGGSGGIGASTTAIALAACGARRWGNALLIDLDPLGGGLDRRIGLTRSRGLRWPAMRTLNPPPGWVDRLPARAGVAVLAESPGNIADAQRGIVRRIIASAQSAAPLVVVDLPRATSSAIRATIRLAHTTVVVAGDDHLDATAATLAAVQLPDRTHVAIRQRTHGPAHPPSPVGDVAEQLQARATSRLPTDPAAGAVPLDPHALPYGPIGAWCTSLLDTVTAEPDPDTAHTETP